jgi:hypothetical protein
VAADVVGGADVDYREGLGGGGLLLLLLEEEGGEVGGGYAGEVGDGEGGHGFFLSFFF